MEKIYSIIVFMIKSVTYQSPFQIGFRQAITRRKAGKSSRLNSAAAAVAAIAIPMATHARRGRYQA